MRNGAAQSRALYITEMTPNFPRQDKLLFSSQSPLNDESPTEQLVNLGDRGKTFRANQSPLLPHLLLLMKKY